MKILVISNLYPPYGVGGYEERCKETVDELARRGHKVSVLTSKWGNKNLKVGENIHRLLFYNLKGSVRKSERSNRLQLWKRYHQFLEMFNNRRNYKIAHEIIRIVKPDLVFIWNMARVGVMPVIAAQAQKLPVVFSVGDYWLLHLKNRICGDANSIKRKYHTVITGLNSFSQLDTRHLLVVSTPVKQTYIDNGFPDRNVDVIPRGVSSNLILPNEELRDFSCHHNKSMKLLFVGRLVSEKAPDVAIYALDILKKEYGVSNAMLDIVGDGQEDYVASLKDLVHALALDDDVNFMGKQKRSLVMNMYQNYDALLFPSRWQEPIGGTILEAMARGLPVVASRHGGPLDIVQDGVNGLLVSGDEPSELAKAVHWLFRDQDLAHRLRLNALNTIHEKFTLEGVVDQTLAYFLRVLEQEVVVMAPEKSIKSNRGRWD